MTAIRKALSSVVLLALCASFALARRDQTDDKDAPQTLINSARLLEQKPLDKESKDIRKWALTWIIARHIGPICCHE